MKYITILITMIVMNTGSNAQTNKSLHDFTVETLDGKQYDLAQLKGKKVLVVNTASKCGFTPQYADLQELYELYGGKDFEIIGFPANNFLRQEPGSNAEIKEFCSVNYGVTFQMMAKISVKGKDIHPVYQWLTRKEENGVLDTSVKWNFQKYMIDEDGKLIDVAYSKVNPMSDKIVNWITGE